MHPWPSMTSAVAMSTMMPVQVSLYGLLVDILSTTLRIAADALRGVASLGDLYFAGVVVFATAATLVLLWLAVRAALAAARAIVKMSCYAAGTAALVIGLAFLLAVVLDLGFGVVRVPTLHHPVPP